MEHIILQDERVQDLRSKFYTNEMPWDSAVKDAIGKATSKIGSPVVKAITDEVVFQLEKELERCIMEKGKNFLQKLFIRLKLKFKK